MDKKILNAVNAIVKFLIKECDALPNNVSAKVRLEKLSHPGFIFVANDYGCRSVQLHEVLGPSNYFDPDYCNNACIMTDMSDEEISSTIENAHLTDDFLRCLVCGWKPNGIKNAMLDAIEEEVCQAGLREIRRRCEQHIIDNFEV